MGLGKTVQLIAFLSGMFDSELVRSCLLLLPSGLLHTWAAEFTKWTPGMRVREFHGARNERTKNLERVQRRGGVVLTSYHMLINNWQQLSSLDGREFTWDYLVLDEAHKVKSKSTKTTKCASAIPAKHRVLLTGTPVQNNLQELWAMFDFACQGSLLGTAKTFKMEYENPITRAREKDATPAEKALGLRISENLMKIIQPYFLRRTKGNVHSTPELPQMNGGELERPSSPAGGAHMPSLTRKNDLIVWVYLSRVQEEIYNNFVSSEEVQEALLTKRSPLVQLTNLKKLCDHPRLLSRRICQVLGLEGCEEEGGATEGSASSDIGRVSDEDLIQESGKLVFLLSLLGKLREEGKRTLVFSQSRKMLDIIQRILTNRGFKCMRLDGTMTLPERQKQIEAFQRWANYCVFLLTTQVGGVGLTLTAANRVVVFDPSWNPATDAQAVDRAYRIGQTDNVVIYRLVTCGSVEEKIYRRQIFKDSLVRQSVGEQKNPFRYFSRQELRELFILEDPRTSSTQRQLQSMHSSQRRTDSTLDQHIAFLHTLEMFGVTDHDLVFSQDVVPDEENSVNDPESRHYIQQRVQKAQELVAAESQLQQQLAQNIQTDTEPGWLNRPREPPTITGRGEGITRPQPDSTSSMFPVLTENRTPPYPPVTVDLTKPVDQEMADEVLNLSCRLAELPIESEEQNDSVVMLDSSVSPGDTHTTRDDDGGGGDSLIADLEPAVCQLSDSSGKLSLALQNSPQQQQQFSTEGQGDESKAELSTSEINSPGSKALFESDFNLVLEETMEEGENLDSDKLAEAKLLMEDSSSSLIETQPGNMEAAWPVEQPSKPPLSPGTESPSSVEEDSSEVFQPWKKCHGRVIASDSEEETEGDLDPPSAPENSLRQFVTSPILKAFNVAAASTPKGLNSPLPAFLNRSGNHSVASRRSLICQVLDDVEDMDEAPPGSVGALRVDDDGDTDDNVSSQSDGEENTGEQTAEPSQSQADGRSVEEAMPERQSVELGAASSDEGVSESSSSMVTGSNEEAGSSEDQSGTFDPELGSDEQLETFTKAPAQLTVIDTRAAGEEAEPTLGEYERLVKRGKVQMEQGELKAALNSMLQALDLRSGDPEVQLITIKLYRQLDQG
ncbi:DNA excision repair protein ERCC-6-like [Carcharodon carcharias]|uniref:DNA excision repair protein ERCC-6-like n=1 Tax=Carcharodon carcharias TaxID=13397 RepID=UPI001B7E1A91|nr:DNA excision repair protein ERCC-6-like [Carcharodon carcharias]